MRARSILRGLILAVPALAVAAAPVRSADAADAAMTSAPGLPPPPGPDAAARLSNAQILQVVRVAETGEIEQAQIAHAKTKDGRIQKLAAQIVRDAPGLVAKIEGLARKHSLLFDASPLSVRLENENETTTRALKMQNGPEFDRSYVDAQVLRQRAALERMGDTLLPSSTLPNLSAHLPDMKATFPAPLTHSSAVQKELEQ